MSEMYEPNSEKAQQ